MTPNRILWINGAATAGTAIAMLAAREALPVLFGLETPRLLDAVAAAFLVYAGALVITASRPRISRGALIAFAAADAAYVVASAIVLALYWPAIPAAGRVLIAAIALVVEVFATLQYRAASAMKDRSGAWRKATA